MARLSKKPRMETPGEGHTYENESEPKDRAQKAGICASCFSYFTEENGRHATD